MWWVRVRVRVRVHETAGLSTWKKMFDEQVLGIGRPRRKCHICVKKEPGCKCKGWVQSELGGSSDSQELHSYWVNNLINNPSHWVPSIKPCHFSGSWKCIFSVAAPALWNEVPTEIQTASNPSGLLEAFEVLALQMPPIGL